MDTVARERLNDNPFGREGNGRAKDEVRGPSLAEDLMLRNKPPQEE